MCAETVQGDLDLCRDCTGRFRFVQRLYREI